MEQHNIYGLILFAGIMGGGALILSGLLFPDYPALAIILAIISILIPIRDGIGGYLKYRRNQNTDPHRATR